MVCITVLTARSILENEHTAAEIRGKAVADAERERDRILARPPAPVGYAVVDNAPVRAVHVHGNAP
jgi:hypothetical protein